MMDLKLMDRDEVEAETMKHGKALSDLSDKIAQTYADKVNAAWKDPLQMDAGITVVLPLFNASPLTRKACEDAVLTLLMELIDKDFHTLWKPYSTSRKNLGELTIIR